MSGTKRIFLRNTGNYVIVDEDDYEKVDSYSPWYENDNGYAMKKTRAKGKNISLRMHRLIMSVPKGLVIDHINGDRLDNRKANLRCVGQQINCWNREQESWEHTKYDLPKGVTFDKNRKKYVATKTVRKRFDTLEEAINFTKESEKLDYGRK